MDETHDKRHWLPGLGKPKELSEDDAKLLKDFLARRIETSVAAGAARLPYPEKESSYRTYDPKDAKITFKGIEIKGYADGTFVEHLRSDDVPLELPRVKNLNKCGSVNVTLISESPDDVLRDLVAASEEAARFMPGKTWTFDAEEGVEPGDWKVILGIDPGVDDLSSVLRARVDQAGTWFFDDAFMGTSWHDLIVAREHKLKMSRRRVLRAQARARKRRRGW